MSAGLVSGPLPAASSATNVVLILADDLGYGDLGSYGSRIETPHCDRLAEEGMRFTSYYSGSPLCSPARAALLTGRYAPTTGVPRVLIPNDELGLLPELPTVPRVLKQAGYRTKCVGKWHLGTRPEMHPLRHGFDEFYGLPYSHDMFPLPLLNNGDEVEQSPRPDKLTGRFTEQAVEFIQRDDQRPFFLYLPHTAPHIPLAPSARFMKRSRLGSYGDVVAELDWSVGEVLRALQESGHERDTLVLFTSDNGPWYQGSAMPLRGRKGTNYEGGARVPLLARYPGVIPAGVTCSGVAAAIDLLPTVAALAGAPAPNGVDGVDISPLLRSAGDQIDRDILLYFDVFWAQCGRLGKWKLHVSRLNANRWAELPPSGLRNLPLPRPELYDLDADPGESYDVAAQNPQVVTEILARMQAKIDTLSGDVRDAWYGTFGIPVQDTPEGSTPRPA